MLQSLSSEKSNITNAAFFCCCKDQFKNTKNLKLQEQIFFLNDNHIY